jgi:glucose/arabinose dehydrogenase
MRARRALAVLAAALSTSPTAALGVEAGKELVTEQKGHSLRPEVIEPTDERVATLRLPPGFEVTKFAEALGTPRMMRVHEDGTLYVTRPDEGDVLALRDEDGDGRAERRTTAISGLADVHDLAFVDGTAYLVTVRSVYRARANAGGAFGEPEKILDGLPDGGRHPNRTIALGPDGRIYVSIGSTCNCCVEEHPEAAAIIRFDREGGGRGLFATGLRNTIGFDWHPTTKAMWGLDHDTDWLGDDFPAEELNLLEAGKDYGWPWVHGDGVLPPTIAYPQGFNRERALAQATSPVLVYTAHAAPIQMTFYDGSQFPGAYRGDAFAAMHGSWNRKPPAGFEVVRVDFENGRPVRVEPFLTGFLVEGGKKTFGRPTGIAVARDGSLLVGDDETGAIYRVTYDRPPPGP